MSQIAFDKLCTSISDKGSRLCIGLDSDIAKLPAPMPKTIDGLLRFNQEIIDATYNIACGYKINFAFYEQYGAVGFEAMRQTFGSIPAGLFTIADAKRGDIGNTAKAYAKCCFEYFGADSVTLNPYLGYDSIAPFLDVKEKMAFILALTSNEGSADFQRLISGDKPVYQHVVERSACWADRSRIGYVVGATHTEDIAMLRQIVPDRVLLIPGIGAQGGDAAAVLSANGKGLALVNVSRSILYASNGVDFAEAAREKAEFYKQLLSV